MSKNGEYVLNFCFSHLFLLLSLVFFFPLSACFSVVMHCVFDLVQQIVSSELKILVFFVT